MWNDPVRGRAFVRVTAHALMFAGIFALGACDATPYVSGPAPAPEHSFSTHAGATATAAGAGHFIDFLNPAIEWQFAFNAVQRKSSGEADGQYHFRGSLNGLAIDFHARVTCMITDPETGRTWLGGVVTQNRSELPPFSDGDIYQAGQPTWMRAADYGEGAGAPKPDRASRIFFTGSGGFLTAEEFCVSGFWPIADGVERITSPLQNGNIQVNH